MEWPRRPGSPRPDSSRRASSSKYAIKEPIGPEMSTLQRIDTWGKSEEETLSRRRNFAQRTGGNVLARSAAIRTKFRTSGSLESYYMLGVSSIG